MIKIGDFAKICNVSTQTLRYYDTEGILKPDYIDETTGYRFYTPQAVDKYKQLLSYKKLGFSLEEIRDLFTVSEEQIRQKLLEKRQILLDEIKEIQARVTHIDSITQSGNLKYLYANEYLNLPFSDDPEVIGKWEICGTLRDENDISSVTNSHPPEAKREIILMPGGAPVWSYFWTKGTVYTISSYYNFAIPHSYRTTEKNGTLYMIMQFMTHDCIEKGADSVPLLYRQINKETYTEHRVRTNIDNTDLPFVEDLTLLGEWETCDYVQKISDFDPLEKSSSDPSPFISDLHFFPRGVCLRTLRKRSKIILRYTKGTLLNDQDRTAEAYVIKEISGKEYLFVQHKSGDYFYGGHTPYYYVFKRKGEST